MKTIPLTRGHVALVDDSDFYRINKFRWHTAVTKHTCYAARWVNRCGKDGQEYMHRVILGINDSRIHADHIDHNGLNNTRANLRVANRSLNLRNQMSRRGTSKYVGVTWHKTYKKWYANISVNKKSIHGGSFDTEIEAARARDELAKLHFGEFAYLNIP